MTQKKPVKNQLQARSSKLESKRKQLENLLRKKARLDFEISTLRKSISKEQKWALKVSATLNEAMGNQLPTSNKATDNLESVICESLGLSESEDTEEAYAAFIRICSELDSIASILLEYN